nr:hypothetical protein [Tanacetum cinerariifolium]
GQEVAFCLGLHFALQALRFVSEDLAFCLQKILRFVFRRSCVLSLEDLAFCLQKILRFVFRRSCVLSSEDLAFCLQRSCDLLRKHYVVYFQDLAFCLRNTAFCLQRSCDLSQKHCVLSLKKCILSGPYKPTTILVQAVAVTDDSLAIPEHTTVETPMNMSHENKAHFQAEKEAIHLILTRIGDEIYSTVDACQTA